ncbi:hypothetical protein K488DRAFT_44421, partial [Vararia minispora EC-137]
SAAAHLGNPCGHTTCGECGLSWIQSCKKGPTCAVCRTSLSADTPLIPNFVADNTVAKHVAALGGSGAEGWAEGGEKLVEWSARKE